MLASYVFVYAELPCSDGTEIWSQAVKHWTVSIIKPFYHALGIVAVFCENIMLSVIISLIENQ